jgi:hypothetical protein
VYVVVHLRDSRLAAVRLIWHICVNGNAQVIAGALNGLSSLLVHFSGDFVAVDKNIEDLYKAIGLSLSIPEKLTRYAVPVGMHTKHRYCQRSVRESAVAERLV